MISKATLHLMCFLVGLSVVAAGCVGDESPEPASGGEHSTQGAAVVSGTSKVTICTLPRYTMQTTVRLCGYTTPGTDGSAIVSAWFTVDAGAPLAVVPGNGGFVDTSTSLAEGTHNLRLYAQSAAGNVTFEEQTVTVDLTPPVLEVLSPTSADVMTSTVVNTTSSVSDVAPVRVQTQWVRSTIVDSGVGTVTHTVDLVNRGYNTLLVRATDAAGNTSEERVTVYFCPSSDAACLASAHWAPVIVGTYQSTNTVPATGGVTFRVVASDPQSSPLSYSWTASIGTLGVPASGPTTSEVVWAPPACRPADAPPSITATVTNALGISSSHPFQVAGLPPCSTPAQLKIMAGPFYNTALKSDGTIWAWGNNSYGQLGDGTTTHRSTAGQVQGLSGVTFVDPGFFHMVALKSDGTAWAWGWNAHGQLGDGTTTNRSTPVPMQVLSGVTSISAGYKHTVALKPDGTVWAWGNNDYGQLGDGTLTSRTTPVQVPGLSGVTAVVAGYSQTFALKADGTAWAWGWNVYGQLGDGTTTNRSTPVQVQGLSGVTFIGSGFLYSMALKSDGTVWTWGSNQDGQLGNSSPSRSSTPVQVQSLSGVTAIAAGDYHAVALKADGTVWAWGWNQNGALGDGTTTSRSTPVQAQGISGATAIAAGYVYTAALESDGTVWAWGINQDGQLGDGTTNTSLTPVQVQGL